MDLNTTISLEIVLSICPKLAYKDFYGQDIVEKYVNKNNHF